MGSLTASDILYSAPFPDGVNTIDLERISLKKLLEHDAEECRRVFEICTGEGFFYLNMLDHPEGEALWEEACNACLAAKQAFADQSMEEKKKYKLRDRIQVIDRGYYCNFVEDDGSPKYNESFNVPQTELFSSKPTDFKLPDWLAPHETVFKEVMKGGNMLANVVLDVLERELKLPDGALTSLHRLEDPSSDFIRIFRYPANKPNTADGLGLAAHKDPFSVAVLFTWLGGLQLPRPGSRVTNGSQVSEEDWRWLKPIPGHAIVNLGEAMEIFTNSVLKAGLHRVIMPTGPQAGFDRYSALVATRPNNSALMKALKSPIIPMKTPEPANDEVMTSEEWGVSKVKGYLKKIEKSHVEGNKMARSM